MATTKAANARPTPDLRDRESLTAQQAASLAELFEVLANGTRLRLLHALVRAGERCVSDLAGDVRASVQAVSNQLARLTARGIVATRREGTRMHYRIVDPCVPTLLDSGVCIAEDGGRCAQPAVHRGRSRARRALVPSARAALGALRESGNPNRPLTAS